MKSGLIDKLEPNDDCMADWGFNIRDLVTKRRATLNIPLFPGVSNFPQRHVHKHDALQLFEYMLRGLFKG